MIVRIFLLRTDEPVDMRVAAAGQDHPQFFQPRMIALGGVPEVEPVASHPVEELVVAPVFPGPEPAGMEGRAVALIEVGQAGKGDPGDGFSRFSGGEPADAEFLQEAVDAVQSPDAGASGDQQQIPPVPGDLPDPEPVTAEGGSLSGGRCREQFVGQPADDDGVPRRKRAAGDDGERIAVVGLPSGQLAQVVPEFDRRIAFAAGRVVGRRVVPPVDLGFGKRRLFGRGEPPRVDNDGDLRGGRRVIRQRRQPENSHQKQPQKTKVHSSPIAFHWITFLAGHSSENGISFQGGVLLDLPFPFS